MNKHRHPIALDPRTKLFLLVTVIISAAMAPSLAYELYLVMLIAVAGMCLGRIRYSFLSAAVYGIFYGLTILALNTADGNLRTTLIAFLSLVHKVYPCGMMAGIVIYTTKVTEFMASMYRIRVPQNLVIPLAVMLRYLPVIREDWRFIKDAMRLRDVSPTPAGLITHPAMTLECVYVPMMMSASKTADELSMAAVTRGIENPIPRTCLTRLRLGFPDVFAAICFFGWFAAGRFW